MTCADALRTAAENHVANFARQHPEKVTRLIAVQGAMSDLRRQIDREDWTAAVGTYTLIVERIGRSGQW